MNVTDLVQEDVTDVQVVVHVQVVHQLVLEDVLTVQGVMDLVQEDVDPDVLDVVDAQVALGHVLETVGPHVQMVARLDALKTVEAVVQVVPVLAVEAVQDHVVVTVQEDAEAVAPLVVGEIVLVVVHHVLDAMDLALVHVGLVALGNAEDVVITVLHRVLLTAVLLVLEHAMVVFQIQFNKIVY